MTRVDLLGFAYAVYVSWEFHIVNRILYMIFQTGWPHLQRGGGRRNEPAASRRTLEEFGAMETAIGGPVIKVAAA